MSHAATAVAATAASVAQPLPAASAAAAAPAPWNAQPYLLQRYYHDDPKKLNDFRLPELDALCEMGQTHTQMHAHTSKRQTPLRGSAQRTGVCPRFCLLRSGRAGPLLHQE